MIHEGIFIFCHFDLGQIHPQPFSSFWQNPTLLSVHKKNSDCHISENRFYSRFLRQIRLTCQSTIFLNLVQGDPVSREKEVRLMVFGWSMYPSEPLTFTIRERGKRGNVITSCADYDTSLQTSSKRNRGCTPTLVKLPTQVPLISRYLCILLGCLKWPPLGTIPVGSQGQADGLTVWPLFKVKGQVIG